MRWSYHDGTICIHSKTNYIYRARDVRAGCVRNAYWEILETGRVTPTLDLRGSFHGLDRLAQFLLFNQY